MSKIRRIKNAPSSSDDQRNVEDMLKDPQRVLKLLSDASRIVDEDQNTREERLERLKRTNPLNIPGMPALNDLGNGIRLRDQFGDNLIHCSSFKRWYKWDGGLWKPDENEREVRKCAQQVASEIYYGGGDTALDEDQRKKLARHGINSGATHRITAMIRECSVMDGIAVDADALDSDPYLLNCLNRTTIFIR